MRLIDADNLGLTDFEIAMCDGDYKEALKLLLKKIENAPTADVVPVSWLEEKLTNHPEIPYAVTDGINSVLDMWREENGKTD